MVNGSAFENTHKKLLNKGQNKWRVSHCQKVSKSQQHISTFFEVQACMTWFDRK